MRGSIKLPTMTTKTKSTKSASNGDSPFKELAELGEIDPGGDNTVIKVRHVKVEGRGDNPSREVIDIRQFITSKNYTGWGKGVMIPEDQIEELGDMIVEYLENREKKSKKAKK